MPETLEAWMAWAIAIGVPVVLGIGFIAALLDFIGDVQRARRSQQVYGDLIETVYDLPHQQEGEG